MFGERFTPPSLHPRTLPVLITDARSWTTDQHVHTRDTAWNDKDAKEYCAKYFLEQHHMTIQVRPMDIQAGGGQHQNLIVCKNHKQCGWRARALFEDKTIKIQYAEPNTHAPEALTFHGVEVSKRNAALVAKQKGTPYNDFVRENPDAGHAVDRRAFVCHRIFLGSSAEIEGEAFGRNREAFGRNSQRGSRQK